MSILKDYNSNIEWNIGSLVSHYEFVWYLIDICKNHIGLELPIKYVFGGIPCKFQGGRFVEDNFNTSKFNNIVNGYNKRGIACRLTFSNPYIKDTDLSDAISNELLQILEDNNNTYMKDLPNKNGVIISLDVLNEYIKEYYPSLERISSQVKPSIEVGLGECKDTADYYNKLFDSYDTVVISPAKVKDDEFLKKIKYPERCEFIANCKCIPNCPRAKDHYEALSDYQSLQLGLVDSKFNGEYTERLSKIASDCMYIKTRNPLLTATFSYNDINKLIDLGFKQFKLEGRENATIVFSHDIGTYIFDPSRYNSIQNAIFELGGFRFFETRETTMEYRL